MVPKIFCDRYLPGDKGSMGKERQIAMDLLYRVDELSGTEIGEIMGVD